MDQLLRVTQEETDRLKKEDVISKFDCTPFQCNKRLFLNRSPQIRYFQNHHMERVCSAIGDAQYRREAC